MRKTFYYNTSNNQKTPATTNTDKNRYEYHKMAMQWYRSGDDVQIVDADTGEIVMIWQN